MADDQLLNEGDTLVTVQMSPCVGGLVQTWLDDGTSRMWSTPDAEWLLGMQGKGLIARTPREQHRFREVGLLAEESGTLLVQSRFPVTQSDGSVTLQARPIRLEPARDVHQAVHEDFRGLLTRAVEHCVAGSEFLVIEKGGWDTPDEPYCLFILVDGDDGPISTIETAPAPHGSKIWEPHIAPNGRGSTLRAPANPETIGVAPLVMIEAISRWGVGPWDLALTFGTVERNQ